ncbi:MAG: leucine-rich repeat domain-containing protein [Candidatus Methanoplasma sp.]|nr:leucine-rich repeat domain-containing protein [Candidatus Methanoplasma sp.]
MTFSVGGGRGGSSSSKSRSAPKQEERTRTEIWASHIEESRVAKIVVVSSMAFVLIVIVAGSYLNSDQNSASVTDTGTSGNITWGLAEGTLTLSLAPGHSGTTMNNYSDRSDSTPSPWQGYTGWITRIIIVDGITSIGDYAFQNCYSMTSVTIPNSVESIGDHAFENCYSMTSVTIPDSVESIGAYAFYGCIALKSEAVTIPDSVSIGDNAFQYFYSLSPRPIMDH